MAKRIWINEHEYVEFADMEFSLTDEIASRKRVYNYYALGMYLPDPDPVLRKQGKDITVYKNLLVDSHIGGCVESRRAGVLSQEWEIKPKGTKRADRKAAEFVDDVFKNIDMDRVIREILDAPLFGYAPLEVMWAKDGSRIVIEDIVGKPPEWFVFDEENRLRFRSKENMIQGELLPPRKFLLARFYASYANPYGKRVMSRCFWPATFKKGGFKFWAIFTEKYAMPWVIGKHPRGASEKEIDTLLDALEQMIEDAIAVIPEDSNIEIKDTPKTASAEIYDKFIDRCDAELSKAIVGQTLTTEQGRVGSQALGKIHEEVRKDIIEGDKKIVKTVLNQAIQWLVDLNYPDAVYPVFSFYEEEDVQKPRAERDEILTRQGVQFTKKYYMEKYNLAKDDFEVLGASTAQQMAMFAEKTPKEPADQQAINNLVATAEKQLKQPLEKLLKPIFDFINSASSYEELQKKLYDLFPLLDDSEIEELLAQTMFMADLWGRIQSEKDTK